MKLFHLSDLHIGKQLHHYNLAAEQREMLAQIVALAESGHPDAILIAGVIDAAVSFMTQKLEVEIGRASCRERV